MTSNEKCSCTRVQLLCMTATGPWLYLVRYINQMNPSLQHQFITSAAVKNNLITMVSIRVIFFFLLVVACALAMPAPQEVIRQKKQVLLADLPYVYSPWVAPVAYYDYVF
nr:uncharacterized protein LOC106690480 [Halyomorpha halys]